MDRSVHIGRSTALLTHTILIYVIYTYSCNWGVLIKVYKCYLLPNWYNKQAICFIFYFHITSDYILINAFKYQSLNKLKGKYFFHLITFQLQKLNSIKLKKMIKNKKRHCEWSYNVIVFNDGRFRNLLYYCTCVSFSDFVNIN